MRFLTFVSLSMAASVEAPSAPMLFQPSLCARGGVGMMGERVSTGAGTKANTLRHSELTCRGVSVVVVLVCG